MSECLCPYGPIKQVISASCPIHGKVMRPLKPKTKFVAIDILSDNVVAFADTIEELSNTLKEDPDSDWKDLVIYKAIGLPKINKTIEIIEIPNGNEPV